MTNQARIISTLQSEDEWQQLLKGNADAIRIPRFASESECAQLVQFMINHRRTKSYNTAAGILRLGTSFSDVRKSGSMSEEYAKPDIIMESTVVTSVVLRLMGLVVSSWGQGATTLTYDSYSLHRAIVRRIVDGGAEPHDDDISKELPEHPVAAGVGVQLGLNLYIEVPQLGGELEGWRRRLTKAEYESMRNPDPRYSYGVRRELLGDPDWQISPRVGDVVIFRNSEIHAIRESKGARATWGFFLGYCSTNRPLIMWS